MKLDKVPLKETPAQQDQAAVRSIGVAEEDRVAQLDAGILRWWTRQSRDGIEAGRAFNELKRILGHGKWQRHFKERFAPSGITLRTAERYMKLANQADAKAKNDNLSIFTQASDRDAQTIRNATERAQSVVEPLQSRDKTNYKASHVCTYRLPLRITVDEKNSLDALRNSGEWSEAERKIVALLRRLFVKFKAAIEENRRPDEKRSSET